MDEAAPHDLPEPQDVGPEANQLIGDWVGLDNAASDPIHSEFRTYTNHDVPFATWPRL